MRRLVILLLLLSALFHGAAHSAPGAAAVLFERDWQWRLEQSPEYATALGERRYNDRLSDLSLAAARARREHARVMLEEARAIERAGLSAQERLSLDLFVFEKERQLATLAFTLVDPQLLTAWDGVQVRLPRLVAQTPFASEEDYRNYIARLNALPAHVDGLIEQLREGIRTGWTAPKASVRAVPDQLRALRERITDGPLGAPLQRIPATIEPALRAQLLAAGTTALNDSAAPALGRLEAFMRSDYLPAARDTLGAASLPGGPGYYAFLARNATGGELTPAELHALGLKEVARIRAALKDVVAQTGFRGNVAQFLAFARSDRRLFAREPEALLARYRRVIERATTRLPALFGALPLEDIGVKRLGQAGAASQVAAYYEAGTLDRSAALVVNTERPAGQPLWEIETLALHEAVPGHHLQVARAHALRELPAFRRHGWDDAFGEGWATYAEGLGPELGFFRDPFSRFGYLNDAMFRAARLVVDTGIHAFGWTRQQALDYLNANTANALLDNEVEVDRYIAQPAQALSYKAGQLRIAALRDKAQAALGTRFDLRRFHDALLGNGVLPLPLLERVMNKWLVGEVNGAEPAPAPGKAVPPADTPGSAPAAAPATAPVDKPPATPAKPPAAERAGLPASAPASAPAKSPASPPAAPPVPAPD
ncbi:MULTISPECIES: DUF885 family protein [unclassified Massilia]|uniref:DUF885 domain-containing protein n=1 Tax=unclassified Massilia TaxID=2609279 RepID=UPI001785F707|nr:MULTISPECIES: DUF885 domain-containing protein [unclassified Massilia]MBD8531393.1 DUF885 domain-containing protein [Massilia sp. CFBP 13647]MBD8674353.1 DUF885 domain-containing protein [Massilia sp. CFBP 13721]